MHRRFRSRRSFANRLALGCSLGASLFLVILGYLSLFSTVMTAAGDWLVGVRRLDITVKRMPQSNIGGAFDLVEFWPIEGGKVYDILAQSGGRYPPATTDVTIPLWIPLVILMVPTVFLWLHRRARPKAGQCPNCRYNLTGNLSCRCPECGTNVTSTSALALRGAQNAGGGSRRP